MKTLLGCGVLILIAALIGLGLMADSPLIWGLNGIVLIGILALVFKASGPERRQ